MAMVAMEEHIEFNPGNLGMAVAENGLPGLMDRSLTSHISNFIAPAIDPIID